MKIYKISMKIRFDRFIGTLVVLVLTWKCYTQMKTELLVVANKRIINAISSYL